MEVELVIIGAGPTGLFATFAAGLREIKSVTLDALSMPGGQITELYPEKYVYDMPGIPKIKGKDLAQEMYKQANTFGADIRFNSKVTDIIPKDDGRFDIEVNGKVDFTTKAVLLCTGVGFFTPNKLNIEGEDQYFHKGVDYTVKDFDNFKDSVVLIVGGGDSAFDFANQVSGVAKKVYLVHHSEIFRAEERSVDMLRASKNAEIIMNTNIEKIIGDGNKVTGAVLFNIKTNERKQIDIDQIIIATGHKIEPNEFKSIKLETIGRYIKIDDTYMTNVRGIFAAGDIANRTSETKLALLAVGVSEAYMAISYIKKYLNPNSQLFGGHTSNLKI